MAQSHYFSKSLTDEYGVYRYKFFNNECIERTDEEMEADRPEPQEPEMTFEELTLELMVDYEYRICMLELGL